MNQSLKKTARLTGVVLTVLAVTGCTSMLSRGISDDGRAEELIFPELNQKAKDRATFVNTENLRKVGAGIGKDDLYYLLGVPHFSETHGAREWDYTFKFRDWRVLEVGPQANTAPTTYCQYKVIFDKNMKGQSFFWSPADCAQLAGDKPTAPSRYRLSSEVLFHYNRANSSDILGEGRAAIDRLAEQIHNDYARIDSVRVVGYTDRLGTAQYNAALSKQRADTVGMMLAQRGFNPSAISTVGAGEANPVSRGCIGESYTQALSECLQPDRRVEVEVNGQRK